jgi:hypothetical protein
VCAVYAQIKREIPQSREEVLKFTFFQVQNFLGNRNFKLKNFAILLLCLTLGHMVKDSLLKIAEEIQRVVYHRQKRCFSSSQHPDWL